MNQLRKQTIKEVTLVEGIQIRNWTLLWYSTMRKPTRSRPSVGCWFVYDSEYDMIYQLEVSELKRFSYRKPLLVEDAPINHMYGHYKKSARERGYAFELNLELFKTLIKQVCDYCGSEPKQYYSSRNDKSNGILTNGIDRKNNVLGYIPDNVLTACKYCNYSKRDRSEQEFRQWLKQIADHYKETAS